MRVSKTGGSLTSPFFFPVLPRGLREDGGKSKGANTIAEMEPVTLDAPEVEHTPSCACDILGLRRYNDPGGGTLGRVLGESLPSRKALSVEDVDHAAYCAFQ